MFIRVNLMSKKNSLITLYNSKFRFKINGKKDRLLPKKIIILFVQRLNYSFWLLCLLIYQELKLSRWNDIL